MIKTLNKKEISVLYKITMKHVKLKHYQNVVLVVLNDIFMVAKEKKIADVH